MNAMNRPLVKVMACGAMAFALAAASSWTFVESSSVLRLVSLSGATLVVAGAADQAPSGARLAAGAATGLLQ